MAWAGRIPHFLWGSPLLLVCYGWSKYCGQSHLSSACQFVDSICLHPRRSALGAEPLLAPKIAWPRRWSRVDESARGTMAGSNASWISRLVLLL
uniref:Secreted protein n=1 Tax=Arundo donax TaxID=35708 RepID=A0A0A9HL67_ARUDO